MRALRTDSQASQILGHLARGRFLTPLSAQRLVDPPCMRLAARIYFLRRRGWDIRSETVILSRGARIAKYWMPGA